jgi:hypothetical protein
VSEKPASLLTKTQRRRLANDFEEVDGAKRRRDQRQIRERVATGVQDFEHLVDYPDDQLELAVEALDEPEVTRALAELAVVAERVRDLRDVERSAVVEAAREVADDSATTAPDRLQFAAPDADDGASVDGRTATPWLFRAERLFQFGLAALALTVVVAVLVPGAVMGPEGGLAALFGAFTLLCTLFGFVGGLVVVVLRSVKHDVAPVVVTLADDPVGAVRAAWQRL